MQDYALFSRRQGWASKETNSVKFFKSNNINDNLIKSIISKNKLVGNKAMIIKAKINKYHPCVNKCSHCTEIIKLCETYPDWYLYDSDTVISTNSSDYY